MVAGIDSDAVFLGILLGGREDDGDGDDDDVDEAMMSVAAAVGRVCAVLIVMMRKGLD